MELEEGSTRHGVEFHHRDRRERDRERVIPDILVRKSEFPDRL